MSTATASTATDSTVAAAATPGPFADAVDVTRHAEYRIRRDPADPRPLHRFAGRIGTDAEFPAEPGRYHLYSGWFCPWAQRTVIVRALRGLQGVVSLSYVDHARDGRGWAFREQTGPDPVNGFTLLRQAYEATEPGFDGHVSVPVLWDRTTRRIVSNTFGDITIDLTTAFEPWAEPGTDTYPVALRPAIDALNERLLVAVNHGASTAAGTGSDADAARAPLYARFAELDERLQRSRYLQGDRITESDVRLWVTLVRFDVTYNADGAIGPRRLTDYPTLWAYARDLYQQPAFGDSTDFTTFARLGVPLADWDAPHRRDPAA
ncbi:MAG TPA: glutathione S-transferase C-terminal domain-containing protein [Kineosporiaceae bacterium]